MYLRTLRLASLLALTFLAGRADAVVLLDGKLNISGYAYWAYGRTDGNSFQLGTQDGYYDNAALALAVRAQPTDDLSAAFQFTQDEDYTQNGVDYAFFEYRASDEVRIRFGMPKVPIGISWDVNDVGTVRPFLRLPSSVYGNTSFGGYSYLGVGLTGTKAAARRPRARLGLLRGRDLAVRAEPERRLGRPDRQLRGVLVPDRVGVDTDYPGFWVEMQDCVGGRLTLITPIQGLRSAARTSGGAPRRSKGPTPTWVAAASLEYGAERWLLRAEYYHGYQKRQTGYDDGTVAQGAVANANSDAGYVEGGVRFGDHWQAVAKIEATKLYWSGLRRPAVAPAPPRGGGRRELLVHPRLRRARLCPHRRRQPLLAARRTTTRSTSGPRSSWSARSSRSS